ncbi:MAG: sigma-70 family RNA polymerase sigma factor [bacterium]
MNFSSRLKAYQAVLANGSRQERYAYEAELIADAASGNAEAFRVISEMHYGRIYRVARRIVRSDEDAADVAQDVLLTLHRKLDSFRGDSELGSWLHRVSANAALMFLRRNSRHRNHLNDDALTQVSSDFSVHRDAEDRETLRALQDAWESLSEKHREVLDLRVGRDESVGEIAQKLDLSVPAAKSRIHRARLELIELAGLTH